MTTIPDTLRYAPVRIPPDNPFGDRRTTAYWKVMDLVSGTYLDGEHLSAEGARRAINRLVAARAVTKGCPT